MPTLISLIVLYELLQTSFNPRQEKHWETGPETSLNLPYFVEFLSLKGEARVSAQQVFHF
jgi:hypothetical protein